MTTTVTIAYKGEEIILEVEAHKEEPMTRHYPGAPAEFEIISASDRDGELLNNMDIEDITNNYEDEIWDALERLAEFSHDDYLLEKRAEEARERYMEARHKD